jgi:hypothetical protein
MDEKSIIIQCSFLLIGGRQYIISANHKTELHSEFIVFPIDLGNETVITSLSFHHVRRVQVLFKLRLIN